VPVVASLFAVGPLIAFGVIAGLSAILRWTFPNDGSSAAGVRFLPPSESDDFGLLSVAGIVATNDDAEALQHMLADAGIRATVTPAPGGRIRVLVFTTDLETARRVVGGSTI
jgi:hypothetical protein